MYAPVYRLPHGQQSYVTRHHQQARKKRKIDVEDLDDSSQSETSEPPSPAFIPIDRNDPYLVAGYSREKPLPPSPFPHAAVGPETEQQPPLDAELFDLKPSVHKLSNEPEIARGSKRQHLDNLTALLHQSVNKGDWNRASRIMGLLLRSEYNGAVDLRRHGRWAMAAEILMKKQMPAEHDTALMTTTEDLGGLQAARQYYERLILQYPHTSRTRDMFNAVTIYPALFNIWVYEVQQRSKLARQAAESPSPSSSSQDSHNGDTAAIRSKEIEEAEPIAARLDELLLGPPYDTNIAMLRLRAMVGLWLSDLYKILATDGPDRDQSQREQRSQDQRTRSEALFIRISQLTT